MAIKEFRLPDPGEGLVEADIVTWHVKVGDRVAVNDIVVEVETSKSLVELPIPFEGEVSALLVSEGDTVDVGTPIIRISDGAGEPAPAVDPVPTVDSGRAVDLGSGAPVDGASSDAEPEGRVANLFLAESSTPPSGVV